ncbi:YadA-like family protein [Acinetobacter sp. VNH17]|uniref:YadA-like family protein n=1 Tax=Acinetobacter thutiue TaxID=2998078 RepID=A0ABT7WRU3_9GAMM|nr:YadA-like family protein [Acinetobacter thutiue]MCY6413283.1 YadA-like family protein [Acinetobacter thutiue]MDN0015392.1 YadA-like family protein [Acinetobacter thutiue]
MKKTFQLSIITVALMASHAYAAPVWEGPIGTGTGLSNAMGGETNYANVDPSANGIILGQLNDVDNTSIGLGYNSNAMGKDSFAAGSSNNASGNSSVTVGRVVTAQEEKSIAVGATINTAKAGSTAIGNDIAVYDQAGTTVGNRTRVRGDQSSSLGDLAWTGGNGATAIGSETWANAENATTLGYNAETGGENTVRIGAQSSGSGLNSVVIGSHATATTEDSIQLGSGGAGAAGIPGTSIADDKNSVAIGYGSDTQGQGASSENTVSVGGLLGGAIRRITQVTDGVDDKDAINVSQLNDAISSLTSGAELIAHADGALAKEKDDRIVGDKEQADKLADETTARIAGDKDQADKLADETAARTVAIDNEAKLRAKGDADAKAARIVAIDNEAELRAKADAEETDARIAGDAEEAAARIAAINAEKDARIAGDAEEKVARIAAINAEKDARIAGDAAEAAARADADLALGKRIDVEAATRTAEVNRLDGRINQASRRLDEVEKSAYRGVAIALAAQQAVPNIRSGQVALFAGVGHYEGETAGSVGLVTSFIANRVSLSGAVGFAGGNEVGGRIGLSYSF